MNRSYSNFSLYNIWANKRLIDDLLAQDERIMTTVVVSSFPTIRATVRHIWHAEQGWLSRLTKQSWEALNVTNFEGSNEELFQKWQQTSKDFANYVQGADPENLVRFGHGEEKFEIPAREIVQTVCNHGSYHRGQIVTIMRQLGVTSISQTDYIEWVRENERGNL